MPEVMEGQILNTQQVAGISPISAHRAGVIREYLRALPRHAEYQLHGLIWKVAPHVIPVLVPRVLHVAY